MAGVGRNEPCWCGSGVKAKRCCGVRRGPSGPELAKAFLVEQRRASSPALRRAIDDVDGSSRCTGRWQSCPAWT
ncbi:MAG: SEC-C metal-binding domain-containing protein [Actinomycetota bacterium]|nr:SEC-C metal-binding domain-containing protein [Actinomycetota bacterium]